MNITPLPDAPSRSDPPSVFIAKADAFLAALPQFRTEINAALGIVNLSMWQSGATYASGTDCVVSPLDFQSYRRKTNGSGTIDPSIDTANWQRAEVSGSSIQDQAYISATTTGTGTAYAITPSPAIEGYKKGQSFYVTFHTASGASPTLQISGLSSPLSLVRQGIDGSYINVSAKEIPANYSGRVTLISSTQAVIETLPFIRQLQSISASVASNALTLTFNGGCLDFRSPTAGSGSPIAAFPIASNSLVIPSGATLGFANGQLGRIAFLEYYNGGAPVAGCINAYGGAQLDETNLVSPTTISSGATSASTFYSSSAVSANSPYRVVGFVDVVEATAGTWATAPSLVQPIGGQAGSLVSLYSGLNASGGAPLYAKRAWVNFNGTGTVAIRASGNVSSITDRGVGQWTVNTAISMPDANYGYEGLAGSPAVNTGAYLFLENGVAPTVSSLAIGILSDGGTRQDANYISISLVR